VPSKIIALTFDDGPDAAMTPRVLDRLEKYGVAATFFVIGKKVRGPAKPVMERALGLGCEYGNHSWDHRPMDALARSDIERSVERTSEAIKAVTGESPKFFRPPFLAVGGGMYASIDLPFCGGLCANDWAGEGTSAQDRADRILAGVEDGAIILLHDVQPEPHPTPEALDILIPALKARGYEFSTMSGLFKQKGIDPASSAAKGKVWTFVG
jgi:peptidoglycan/xylan/chitin deacetylase (PgdA/CDA1 family)